MNRTTRPDHILPFWAVCLRWGLSLFLVVGAYSAAAVSLYAFKDEAEYVRGGPEALMLEFAETPTAPVVEKEADIVQPETVTEDEEEQKQETEPEPEPEANLEPEPEQAQPKKPTPPKTKAPNPTAQKAQKVQSAAAPHINAQPGNKFAAPGNNRQQGASGTADPGWKNKVQAKIDGIARRVARQHPGVNGFAVVLFSYDGRGAVTSTTIARSTGKQNADSVALKIARQSSPLPPPPGGKAGQIMLRVKF